MIGADFRYPSAFCGTVGHKPSGRLVPSTGHFPMSEDPIKPALCLGPLTRHVEDLMPLLRVLAGPDGVCPVTRDFDIGDPAKVDLSDLTVYKLDTGRWPLMRQSMLDGIDRSARALADRGARIETLEIKELRFGVEIWAAVLEEGTPDSGYADILSPDRKLSVLKELLKMPLGRSRHTLPAMIMVAAEGLTRFAPGRTHQMLALAETMRSKLQVLGDRGIFLYPPYTRPAPRHFSPMLTPFDGACTCTFNVLELPVTVVPVGFDHRRLPVAVQIGALPGNDHLTIAAAGALEEDFGGWQMADPHTLT